MKKIFSLLLGLFLLSSIVFAQTTYSYDKYGSKTGSYKQNSNGTVTQYDALGRKLGTYKRDSSGKTTYYDQYGRKVNTYK